MIEDNGFLTERGVECETGSACLASLAESERDWRELRLSGVNVRVLDDAKRLGLPLRIEAERPTYFVDVSALSAEGNLESLSANARQQVNRSLRLYRERGEVSLRPSESLDEALTRFVELERLHQKRWTKRGMPGAFGAPFFRRFHRTLLAQGFAAGAVDVLRAAAGSTTIGLLYSFFHAGCAYSYQNGFEFEADDRLKPGLVSHLLAIRFCRDIGLQRYCLLAGDSRYKRSLATGSYELYWLSIRRPDLAFRLEQIARRITGRE